MFIDDLIVWNGCGKAFKGHLEQVMLMTVCQY